MKFPPCKHSMSADEVSAEIPKFSFLFCFLSYSTFEMYLQREVLTQTICVRMFIAKREKSKYTHSHASVRTRANDLNSSNEKM